jgi:hypothetical protein
MYTLDSTAGLRTTTFTAEKALAVLGQHLHDLGPDGPLDWLITIPGGDYISGTLDLGKTSREAANLFIRRDLNATRHQLHQMESPQAADLHTGQ